MGYAASQLGINYIQMTAQGPVRSCLTAKSVILEWGSVDREIGDSKASCREKSVTCYVVSVSPVIV